MKRGFTLIELLIVIGILSILATTVTLALNPANLLKESRDIQRITDLRAVQLAINLYIVRVSSPVLDMSNPVSPDCTVFGGTVGRNWFADTAVSLANAREPFQDPRGPAGSCLPDGAPAPSVAPVTLRGVNGEGWVPIDFLSMSSGSPLPKLPIDPNPELTNALPGGGRYYAYHCEGLTYEINANMESQKYGYNNGGGNEGAKDVESKDGGAIACGGSSCTLATRCNATKALDIYEVGNDPGLDL